MSIEIKISRRRISYINAMKLLNKRVAEIKNKEKSDLLWILEHPVTYTAGIRYNRNEILDKKIKIIKTNRGGKITLHNPGQKIIYFVLDLNKRKKDIRKLIQMYKINAKTDKKNIGIWVNKKKIAAIGLRVSKWIAFHGCSININNDLNQYLKIVPCGLDNKKVTSIYEEKNIKIKNIEHKLIDIFIKNIKKI